jgi:hypothetical protein
MCTLTWIRTATLALVVAACGGKVVVDQPGSGGGGTTDCATLQTQLGAAVAAAMACSPFVNSIQCDGSAIVYDACGCPFVANETNSAAVSAAAAAYAAWTSGSCGPLACDACVGLGTGGYCDPSTSACAPVNEL